MTGESRQPFNYRAFWSLLLAVSAVGLPWSGIELHAAGHGGWTRATHGWMAVHWVFVLLFLIGAAGHLVLNRRALVRYCRGVVPRGLPFSREALTALAITAGLVLLAVGHTRLDRRRARHGYGVSERGEATMGDATKSAVSSRPSGPALVGGLSSKREE